MNIKIKKLIPAAIIPTYAKEGDAGLDLTAINRTTVGLSGFGYIEYETGLAIEIPKGYAGLIFPRSSISKTGLWLANSVGLIDSGYRGEIKLRYKWIPNTNFYEIGEKVGQLVIMPYPEIELEEVETLSETERGEGGFGSTNG